MASCSPDQPANENMPNDEHLPESSGIDKLFDRMKSDLMFELRSIKLGDRPVTGQNHRERLQEFMMKHIAKDDEELQGKETDNRPSNVDQVEVHRPEAVVVEVQGIIEQRPVTNILHSAAFRRQLENIISGNLQSHRRDISRPAASNSVGRNESASSGNRPAVVRNSPAATATTDTRSNPTFNAIARNSPAASATSDTSNPTFNAIARNSPATTATTDTRSNSTFNAIARNSPAPLSDEVDNDLSSLAASGEPERMASGAAATTGEAPEPPTESGYEARGTPSVSTNGITWNDVSYIQREEIVEEIRDLLHSHLVSSTLESQFRGTLELLVEERLSASGSNGQAVLDALNTLPPSAVARNDFSHLGIPSANDVDSADNVSVTSLSVHAVPYTQTNSYMSREIQSLKKQLNEMKNMLKLNFDLQMDIQRAIRQEVAAALSSASNGASSSQEVRSTPVNDTHCLICVERHTDTVLYQCGHMCVCYVCGKDLISKGHHCPVCRAPIKDVIRAFKTNAE